VEHVISELCAYFSLIHSIVTRVIRLAQNKSPIALAPALVETYSRLLVYIEIESLGIKGFISKLLLRNMVAMYTKLLLLFVHRTAHSVVL